MLSSAGKTSVAVMDFNGFQKDKLSLLVPLASNLKVITGNPEEFSPVRRRLYDDWGLAMTVTENVNEAGGCTFVIAPRTDKSNPDGGAFYIGMSIREVPSVCRAAELLCPMT